MRQRFSHVMVDSHINRIKDGILPRKQEINEFVRAHRRFGDVSVDIHILRFNSQL